MMEIQTKIKSAAIVKEKHEKITEAAAALFAEHGFHKTSMRQIAEASGIELSYLYKYISSKDDILLLFYKRLHDRYFPIFRRIEEEPDQNPAEQLIEVITSFFKRSKGYYKQTMAAYMETRHLTKDRFNKILKKEAEYTYAFLHLIERGIKAGCFHVEDPLLSANFIAHLIIADMARGWACQNQRTTEEVRDEMIRFILNALGYNEQYAIKGED